MISIWSEISDSSLTSFLSVVSPTSRLFYWNLAFSVLCLFAWILYRSPHLTYKDGFRKLASLTLRKKYWWNKSTKTDLALHAINSVGKGILLVLTIDWGYQFSKSLTFAIIDSNPNRIIFEFTTLNAILFFAAFFLLDDLSKFCLHYLTHKVPWLWKLHKVHHSATVLTPLTVYRIHPLEMSLSVLRQIAVNSIFVSIFVVLFEKQLSPAGFFGVAAVPFIANFLASNFRHSHIPISFGKLEYLLMSPKQHQIHHSIRPEFFDKNFGDTIGLWDWFFGTLCLSNKAPDKLKFGLGALPAQELDYRQALVARQIAPLEEQT